MARSLPAPATDETAPEIDLATTDGEAWLLSECRGRTVLVIFHRHIH